MQRFKARGSVEGATQRLAIEGHDLLVELSQGLHPGDKTLGHRVGVKQSEGASEGIVRRDATRQVEEVSEEVFVLASEEFNADPIIEAPQGGSQREEKDVQQRVVARASLARVRQRSEVDGDSVEQSHGRASWRKSTAHVLSYIFPLRVRECDCPVPSKRSA